MTPAAPLACGNELLADRYRLTQRITAAADGEVWQGTDVVLGRPVAVELLRAGRADEDELLGRFRDKARLAGSVTHAGLARIYDSDEACFPYPPFLVMELTDGPSLAEAIADQAPLEPSLVMDIVAQVAAALHAVHRAGLVHCAIKPGNILTTRDGQVKLTGLENPRAMGTVGHGPPTAGPCYLAPEQLTGHPGTAASDLYALGVTARQCLTGSPPSGSAAPEPTLADQMRPTSLPPAILAQIAMLIGQLTARDPALRPNAAEVADRAAKLRDRMRAGALALPAAGPRPAGGPGAAPSQTLPEALPHPVRMTGRKRRLRYGLLPSMAIPVVVIVGMFLGLWHHGAGYPAPAAPATTTMVDVNAAALTDRPVGTVRALLRQLRLRVRIRWVPSYQMPAGRVISVAPAGRMPTGTLVTVTGASQPAGTSYSPVNPNTGGRPATRRGKHRVPAARPTSPSSTVPVDTSTPSHSPSPTAPPSTAGSSSPAPTATQAPTQSPAPTGSPSTVGNPGG